MKMNFKNITILFAACIFLLALAININISINKPFATLSDLVLKANAQSENSSSQAVSGSASSSSWWDSLTHRCVPNCACMLEVFVTRGASGTWSEGGGGAGYNEATIRLQGKRTECVDGEEVAHCTACTERSCVVPNDIIIEAIRALNGK